MSDDAREKSLDFANDARGESFGFPPDGGGMQEDAVGSSPIKLVLDRMHGRWLLALILAVVLAPIFSVVGYQLGPVLYDSTAVLAVESRLETLVEETPETREIKVDQEVQEQAQLLRDPSVLYKAVNSDALKSWTDTYPNLAERIQSQLRVSVPRGAALILVSVSDADPRFAKAAVTAIVDAYEDTYIPNYEKQHRDKVNGIQRRIDASRSSIDGYKRLKVELLKDSQYAITDVNTIISSNVERIRRLEMQLAEIDGRLDRIQEWVIVRASLNGSDSSADTAKPSPLDRVEPSLEDLADIDPELMKLKESLSRMELGWGLVQESFGTGHPEYRRTRAAIEAQRANLDSRMAAARTKWETSTGTKLTYEALGLRRDAIGADLQDLRKQNTQLALDMIEAEELQAKIEAESGELQLLNSRYLELDRERDSIRKGRVAVTSPASTALSPSTNKKATFSIAGGVLGFGGALGIFFLMGTIDQKTFGVRQLEDSQNTTRVLGVMPDMDETDSGAESVLLATDCVHRIRARIEARRSPERGYALMVSSPFQGDGKTTLAVSLGWSYAESGYKTLMIDADFIGRAMSHQFGHLKEAGLREIIRNGEVKDEIKELGHPNLSLLSVGFDRRISAANLSPRLMSRVLNAVRDEYDLILLDSGPITASIEAMPVASASDGVVLALRRGRSRARLTECISDIRSVGSDYLGVVLNYADKNDCLRHGSTSRMSVSVQAALEGTDPDALPESRHPMIEGMGTREERHG